MPFRSMSLSRLLQYRLLKRALLAVVTPATKPAATEGIHSSSQGKFLGIPKTQTLRPTPGFVGLGCGVYWVLAEMLLKITLFNLCWAQVGRKMKNIRSTRTSLGFRLELYPKLQQEILNPQPQTLNLARQKQGCC